MKKIICAVALMFCSVATAFAQQNAGTISFQPKVGLNFASEAGKDHTSDARLGFVGGLEATYQVTDMIGISAGALYSQQGGKEESVTHQVDYLNVPVLANVYVLPGLAVKLGLQPGFKLSEKHSYKDDKLSGFVSGDAVKGFDLSLPIGLSYEFSNIVLDARYNFGLTNMYDISNYTVRNSVFQFTLGYKLGF